MKKLWGFYKLANIQNLKPFKKGHKGIGGRPKGSKSITVILKKLVETEASLQNPFNGDIYINKDKEIGREYGVETSYTQGCQERRAFVAKREFLFVLHTCIGLGQNGEVFNQMLSTFTLY